MTELSDITDVLSYLSFRIFIYVEGWGYNGFYRGYGSSETNDVVFSAILIRNNRVEFVLQWCKMEGGLKLQLVICI